MDWVDLVRQARRGDVDSFERLARRFEPMARAYAYRVLRDHHLAEDVAQEAFLETYRRLPQLARPAAFPSWLRRIVFKYCDREMRRLRPSALPVEDQPSHPDDDPARTAVRREERREVWLHIRSLPKHERPVVVLYYVNEYSQQQIASVLGLPVTTVKSRLYEARQRLREAMEMYPAHTHRGQEARRVMMVDTERLAIHDLIGAVREGAVGRVAAMLAERPDLVHETAGAFGGETPLHVAAQGGEPAVARLLLKEGADVMARDKGDNATPLHWAADRGDLAMAQLLVEHGADVNATDDVHVCGPLGWCTVLSSKHPELAAYLMEQGAQPSIFIAIALNLEDRLRQLVSADTDVLSARMSTFERHQGPLHFAVSQASEAPEQASRMVDFLLELGADPTTTDDLGVTPLALAAVQVSDAIVKRLQDHGVKPDFTAAVALGRKREAERLLAQQPDFLEGDGRYLLHFFIEDRPDAAILLLELGADATAVHKRFGSTALHLACWHGHREAAEALIDHGADLNVRDRRFDSPPIGWANENGQQEMVNFMLAQGARINARMAAAYGKKEILAGFLQDVPGTANLQEGWGTPLHDAVLWGHKDFVQLLLENGADVNARTRRGETALTLARRKGHEAIEALLLEHGARLEEDD